MLGPKSYPLRAREAELEAENSHLRGVDASGSARELYQRAIFESAIDLAIIATDPHGRITDWNKGAERILGWSAEEMRGELVDRFFTLEDRSEDHAELEMRRAWGEGYTSTERWHLKRDGSYFWAKDETVPLRGEDGSHLGFVKTLRDRTKQKLLEVDLQARQAHFGAALAIAELGTFDWNLLTGMVKLDDRSRAIFGFSPDQGGHVQEIFDRIAPCDFERVFAETQASRQTRSRLETEYRINLPDGGVRTIVSISVAVAGAGGKVERLIGVFGDITERKRAEAALRDMNQTLEQRVAARTLELQASEDRLRQSQKMEAVGQLTGGLAHDFNNLLTVINGSLEILQTRLAQGQTDDLNHYIAAAQGASMRAAALTHRLLAFSRRQTLNPKAIDVNRLVAGMEDLLRRTMGPEVDIEVVATSDLWITRVDPNQLENVLLNLCINAHHAMPNSGRLTVETANTALSEQMAREHDLPAGQYLSLCVTDTGTGMSPEVISRVFEPFFTTKPVGQGSGLGLSMVYGFARQSGGHAWINSKRGEGTTVCLYLPRHPGDAENIEIPAETAEIPRTEGNETVLVVDDEVTLRELVSETLRDLGYTTIEAADGAAALKVLRSQTHVDLLISDVGLPGGMDGYQMASAARASHPSLKILFITGYDDSIMLPQDRLELGRHVLTKPFAMRDLANRIKEIIALP